MNIQDVPLDVISHIFEFLNVEEVGMRCSLVCQTWKEAASSAICWHVFYCRDIDAVPFTDADDWKQKYRTDFVKYRWDPSFCSSGGNLWVASKDMKTLRKKGNPGYMVIGRATETIDQDSGRVTIGVKFEHDLPVGSQLDWDIGLASRGFQFNYDWLRWSEGTVTDKHTFYVQQAHFGQGDTVIVDVDVPQRRVRIGVRGAYLAVDEALDVDTCCPLFVCVAIRPEHCWATFVPVGRRELDALPKMTPELQQAHVQEYLKRGPARGGCGFDNDGQVQWAEQPDEHGGDATA